MSDEGKQEKDPEQEAIQKAVSSLKLRGIGPAVMGGRIIDIAVHPTDKATWYVAAGSGGVWKTSNAGTTWQDVFAKQPSYSIGCVAIDPTTPHTIWVGTGENVSGRHVGWGDGIYKSMDGGQTWAQMGLPKSEHIGKILIDPRDGNTVYVAAEGALWAAGGERGIYKTTDGGSNWTHVLDIDENTGVTDIVFDPSNPDTIYAAAYQRRRHIWAHLAGGPESGIYKTTDSGANWRKIKTGLPKGDMGKIGLAVTAANPDLVYATIEADKKEKGFYRSANKGESWTKQNDYVSGGTGPHYYQVLAASQSTADVVYQMDVFVHVTRDGGKSFTNMEDGKHKHSDNHALWIDPDNGDHLIVGCDGGLLESFDHGASWRHFPNMPLSQFYRVAVDNSLPFYNVMGGAQDLGTLFGPSRTNHIEGVRNQDWYVPLGADGYHVDFDPEEPDTLYLEFQVGNSFRYNRKTEEIISIKPQPAPDEPPERWNWDAPILVSAHDKNRLYVASQRVWRSDDRGNSWQAISPDLTRNQNRYELEMMGRVWSVDALYDNGAMSFYSTITNFSESAVAEGMLYVGTDDGLVQVSEDGGRSWRQAAPLPDVPEMSFIQCVQAGFQAETLFASADAHKFGDFNPYLFVSQDNGRSWQSIVGDLPESTIVWAVRQDEQNENILFAATEYALYVTLNFGENWYKLDGNVPTIAFRDLKIQRRENDLVGASFGRGFYILDDYTPLRDIADGALDQDSHLFPVRDTWWYIPHFPMQSRGQPTLGTTAFKAENPPHGPTFTYYLKEKLLTAKEKRHKAEKEQRKAGTNTPFPGWDVLTAEMDESEPKVLLLVRNSAGEPIRWVKGSSEAGLHRASWDMRLSPPDPIILKKIELVAPWMGPPIGAMVPPGEYSVQLYTIQAGEVSAISPLQTFTLKPLPSDAADEDFAANLVTQQAYFDLSRQVAGLEEEIGRTKERLMHIQAALVETAGIDLEVFTQAETVQAKLNQINIQLSGNPQLGEREEPQQMALAMRAFWGCWTLGGTRQAATQTQKDALVLAETEYKVIRADLIRLLDQDLADLEAAVAHAGAPWTPGRRL